MEEQIGCIALLFVIFNWIVERTRDFLLIAAAGHYLEFWHIGTDYFGQLFK
jgi:hypothetical protein